MAQDPLAGLPLDEVGEWTLEKHARLRRYVDISRKVREKFLGPGKAGATFIDLYCGAGQARVRETGEVIDGSPLVAFEAARSAPYSTIHLADVDQSRCNAALARLRSRGGEAAVYVGPAEQTVHQVCEALDPHALHFAFLDPFSLGALPFEVIRRLSAFKRMDLLIHVSSMDFQRNLREFISGRNNALDQFAPGWRDKVDTAQSQAKVRRQILEHWLSLIRALDMQPSQGIERVVGSKRQPLYWLVFVARHELAREFWDKIRDVTPQSGFRF
jgi:three-Cys-motif partner protein